jgi:hypothetical protein
MKLNNNYIHTDHLTLPIFGSSANLFTTAKSFIGWLAAGDVWRCFRFAGTSPRMSNAFTTIQYQNESNHAGHQMDGGRRKRRATHPYKKDGVRS